MLGRLVGDVLAHAAMIALGSANTVVNRRTPLDTGRERITSA
jgi:hypothetical protein